MAHSNGFNFDFKVKPSEIEEGLKSFNEYFPSNFVEIAGFLLCFGRFRTSGLNFEITVCALKVALNELNFVIPHILSNIISTLHLN